MNSQEQEIEANVKPQQDLENRRRFIKGAGIATPVVLTLSSQSVFGGLCGSQIASGNQSHVVVGNCDGINSNAVIAGQPAIPTTTSGSVTSRNVSGVQSYITKDEDGKWTKSSEIRDSCVVLGKLQNKENKNFIRYTINLIAEPTKGASYSWVGGVKYGDLNKYVPKVESILDDKGNKVEKVAYTSVSQQPSNNKYFKIGPNTNLRVGDSFPESTFYTFTGGVTYKGVFGTGPDLTFREILNNTNQYKKESYLVTAFLNTKILNNYALSEQEVRDLASGTFNIPKGYTFESFLEATWK